MDGESIRQALRCGRPRCACQRGKMVHCPAHEDADPSFSVEERDGRLLVHCFSGCTQEEVIEALRSRGLWQGRPPTPRPKGILADVTRFLSQYVMLPSDHARVAVALWVLHTWVLDAFDVTPYLVVKSAEKRSGKTRLQEVLELLTPRAWRVVQPSEAVIFRKISRDRPTLLLDEADTIFRHRGEQYEPIRAVLNAGFRRGAVVPRCVGEGAKQELINFSVFGAKALAAIGDLPDTVEDRSIIVRLDRATPEEQSRIRRLRFREAEVEAAPIREALAKWAERVLPALREARPALPDTLDGRAADAWEPLLAVADQAGDGWAVVAWETALALSTGAARADDSLRVRLLGDIRRVFEERGADRLATADLIEGLCEDEAAPWGDWRGRRITPQALSRLLRPFRIFHERWRDGDSAPRGYIRAAFADAFSRYIASELVQVEQRSQDAGFSHFEELVQTPRVPDGEIGANAGPMRVVPVVPVSTPLERDGGGDGEITLADVERVLGPVEVLSDALECDA